MQPASRSIVVGVVAEPRAHPALSFIVPTVARDAGIDVLLFHGRDVAFAQRVAALTKKRAGRDVTLLPLGVNDLSARAYALLLLSADFWGRVAGAAPAASHALLFEADSCTCGGQQGAAAFAAALQYDYCGAVWRHATANARVGNSGFSLIRLSAIRAIAEAGRAELQLPEEGPRRKFTWRADKTISLWCGGHSLEVDGRTGLPRRVTLPTTRPRCRVCPTEVAAAFAVESVHHPAPWAFHKVWQEGVGPSWPIRRWALNMSACTPAVRQAFLLNRAAEARRAPTTPRRAPGSVGLAL